MPPCVSLPRLQAGYWISPNNHFFTVKKHIDTICDSPDAFGTREKVLREVFERFGEPWRSEQKAREAIMLTLIQCGWIRTRNYVESGADYWVVNMPAIDMENLARVCAFMRLLYPEEVSYAPVYLRNMKDTESTTVLKIRECTPVQGYLIDPKALPVLTCVVSPDHMPAAGIPEISFDACYPET